MHSPIISVKKADFFSLSEGIHKTAVRIHIEFYYIILENTVFPYGL